MQTDNGDSQGSSFGLEWLSRSAAALLALVLALSTFCAFSLAKETRKVAFQVDSERLVATYLHTAQRALAAEQSLEREYRLLPDADTFIAHRAAATQFANALTAVRDADDASGRAAIVALLAKHRTYLDVTRQLFIATNRNDVKFVTELQRDRVDIVYSEIDDEIGVRVTRQAAIEAQAITQLHDAQSRVVNVMLALSLIGIGCLICFLLILRTYRDRLKRGHEAELRKLADSALLDGLTGIGNHRAYKQDLLREVARAERRHEPLSLVLLDVDDFKTVNDRDGHLQGDCVLAAVAKLFDTLRADDRPYRIGGDEFAVILSHATIEDARRIADRLQSDARRLLFGSTLSIGLASLGAAVDSADALQARADAAMYAAKRSGRNTIANYDEVRDGMWLLSPGKVHDLRRLINAGAMNVVYQPIWDVEGCSVFAYEALARPDPSYGFASPQDAFDLADRIGRSHELDRVCREAALVQAAGLPAAALLFINISPQSLDHGRLDVDGLLKAVDAAGLVPERIVIEITERSVTHVEVVIAAAQELREHGFRLALDDTGAGNSGLEMLSRLTLDFVKIDREVVARAVFDKKARGVVAGIIAIANASDAYVIAEGIETTEMLKLVCGSMARVIDISRVHGVQGYLLRRPRETFLESDEAAEVTGLLRDAVVVQAGLAGGGGNVAPRIARLPVAAVS